MTEVLGKGSDIFEIIRNESTKIGGNLGYGDSLRVNDRRFRAPEVILVTKDESRRGLKTLVHEIRLTIINAIVQNTGVDRARANTLFRISIIGH